MALDDLGVSIALVDGFHVFEGQSVQRYRRTFEILAELGASRVNTTSFDADAKRTLDEVGQLAALAAEYGVTVTIESCPVLEIRTVAHALELIDAIALQCAYHGWCFEGAPARTTPAAMRTKAVVAPSAYVADERPSGRRCRNHRRRYGA